MISFLFFDSENCREGVGSSNFILNIFCAAIYIFGSASFNASSSFADSLYPCSFRLTNSLNEPASAAARAILKAGDNFSSFRVSEKSLLSSTFYSLYACILPVAFPVLPSSITHTCRLHSKS